MKMSWFRHRWVRLVQEMLVADARLNEKYEIWVPFGA